MNKIVIESISQKRNSKKFVVKTNEEEYIMTEDTIIKFHIFKDKEFSKEEFKKIIYDIKISESFNKTLNYLSYGPRSEYEIRLYIQKNDKDKILKSKDFEEIVSRLKALNYINDDLYSNQIVEYYKQTKGRNFIYQYLRDKKIKNEYIENALSLYEDDEEIETGLKISIKYIQTIRKYPFRKQQTMMMAKLNRAGFSSLSISKILSKLDFVDDSDETLRKDILKVQRRIEKKDLTSYEKKQYIINSLMQKGYEYRKICDVLK